MRGQRVVREQSHNGQSNKFTQKKDWLKQLEFRLLQSDKNVMESRTSNSG